MVETQKDAVNKDKKRLIALYGGSFNPPTDFHLFAGRLLRDRLGADEVWYLVSPQNPDKTADDMAEFRHRLAMTEIAVGSEPKLFVKDIEARYGTTHTADTLQRLIRDYPDDRFVWVMGADNFATFHSWGDKVEWMQKNFPMVIIPRKGVTQDALRSPAALSGHAERILNPDDLRSRNGWHLLSVPEDAMSATRLRTAIRQAETPQGIRPGVLHYIRANGLYAMRC